MRAACVRDLLLVMLLPMRWATPQQAHHQRFLLPLSTPHPQPRPGNVVQDSVSVMATLNTSHFTSYHKFGLVGGAGRAGASHWVEH